MLEMYERKRRSINQYEGMDTDRDSLNDAREIEVGLHNERNQPLHRLGPTTPGSAHAVKGRGIVFNYDNSIVNLNVRPTNNIGSVHKMNSPKPMKLSVDIGGRHDASKFQLNLDVHPERHRLNIDKIKPVKGVPKNAKNKAEINNLSSRSSNFAKSQKQKSSGVDLTSAKKLDFSHVGITRKKVLL